MVIPILSQVNASTPRELPPEFERFAHLRKPKTRPAYQNDLQYFMRFVGIGNADEFRTATAIEDDL